MSEMSFDAAFKRLSHRLTDPICSVIDIGASDGRWAGQARRWLPNARYHLIEANHSHEPGLQAFVSRTPNTSCVFAAAGPTVGEGHLWISDDPFGGTVMEHEYGKQTRTVPQTTIDHEVESLGLKGPFFLKFDTHGFEKEILAGAVQTLRNTRLIQMEMYNFEFREGIAMHRVMAHIETLGFRCSEIFEPLWRPSDQAFWQIDMLFEPVTARVFQSNGYLAEHTTPTALAAQLA
jgi:FkbM family methyltransferase